MARERAKKKKSGEPRVRYDKDGVILPPLRPRPGDTPRETKVRQRTDQLSQLVRLYDANKHTLTPEQRAQLDPVYDSGRDLVATDREQENEVFASRLALARVEAQARAQLDDFLRLSGGLEGLKGILASAVEAEERELARTLAFVLSEAEKRRPAPSPRKKKSSRKGGAKKNAASPRSSPESGARKKPAPRRRKKRDE